MVDFRHNQHRQPPHSPVFSAGISGSCLGLLLLTPCSAALFWLSGACTLSFFIFQVPSYSFSADVTGLMSLPGLSECCLMTIPQMLKML